MAILGKTSITELDLIQPLSNENIANNFITVNGTRVSLGGSITTPNTDTSTTESGHYTPSTAASTVGATSGNNYIRGISLDSKKHVISVSTGTPTDTNTWRPVYNGVDSTDTSSAATANAVKTAYDKAVSAYNLASGKTSNVGTVTSVKVTGGTGLSGGGTVTSSGTITLNHAAAYTGTSLTKSTSGANYYLTAVTLSMDGLGHVTGISGSESYDDDANTHYTTRLYAGASETAAHSAVTNPYLKVTDDNTYRNQIRFVGGGATTITSDSAGTITITSTDTDTDTNNYLTGVSGSGNGTVTFARQGLSSLTWNASHTHDGYVSTAGGSIVAGTTNFNKIQISGSGASYGTGATLFFGDVESEVHLRNTADRDLTIYAAGNLKLSGGSITINGSTPSLEGHGHPASSITGGTNGYFLKADSSGKGVWTNVTIPSAYTLPTASSSTKGGIKVGSFLGISSEVLSVSTGTSSTTVARGDHSHSGVYQPAGSYLSSHQSVKFSVGTNTATTVATYTDPYINVWGNGEGTKDSVRFVNAGFLTIATNANNGKQISWAVNTGTSSTTVARGDHSHSGYLTGYTDSACTLGGHYTPSSSTTITAKTSGADYYVTGVTLNVDSKGHVTAMSVGSSSDDKGSTGSYLPLSGGTLTGTTSFGYTGETVFQGDIRLKTDNNNYNRKLYFGDGDYCYIHEYEDDHLKISVGDDAYVLTIGETVGPDDNSGFNFNSEVYAPAFYQTSDEKLKDFGNDIEVDFDKLKTIPKKYFTWKDGRKEGVDLGTSAQKVRELYPEIVSGEKTLSVDYSKLSIIALKAVDKLHEENEMLKSLLAKMEERLSKLEENK